LELSDDIRNDLQVTGAAGNHDTLAAWVVTDAGGGGDLARGRAPSEGLGKNGSQVGALRRARTKDPGELNRLRSQGNVGQARLPMNRLVDFVDELFDLLQLTGNRGGDDQAILLGVR